MKTRQHTFRLSFFFVIVNQSDAQLSSITTGQTPVSNAVGPNSIVYVSALSSNNLKVFDFTDKYNPTQLYSTTTPAGPGSVVLNGNYLYLGTTGGKLVTYNVSTPGLPVNTNTLQVSQDNNHGVLTDRNIAGRLVISGNYLLAGFIVDRGNGGEPQTRNFLVKTAMAVGANFRGGFFVFDISSSTTPTLVKRVDFNAGAFDNNGGGDIVQNGNLIYVTDYYGRKLRVYDISDILNPVLVQTISNITEPLDYRAFHPSGLIHKDSALYILSDNILQVYDTSSSTNVVYNKTIVAQKDIAGFSVKDNILYISASSEDKLSYYDVTDALNPSLISEVSTPTQNNNSWLSIDVDGYYYVNSTGNNIVSVYEPLKVINSKQAINVIKDTQDTYRIRLATTTNSDVVISISTTTSAIEPCIIVSPTELTFTNGNWNIPQTVTIQSASGDTGCPVNSNITITTTASSSNSYYNNALISDIDVTITAGFISVRNGPWNDGFTWGEESIGTAGIDYPATTSNAFIYHAITLSDNTEVNTLNIAQGGNLNLNSKNLTASTSVINNGYITGDITFSGLGSYNQGTVSGINILFTNEAYNDTTGNVYASTVTFSNLAYNQGTVSGDAVFVGDDTVASGAISGYQIRKYISDATTERNFLTDNNYNAWIVIADNANVNISSSTYATTTNIFKAINNGSFITGDPGIKVTPDVVINSPYDSESVTKFTPSVSWDNSTICEYSYDNFATTTNTITCSNNGSDIAKPDSSGSKTLTVRGTNAYGSLEERSITFTYDNTTAIPTTCGTDLLDEATREYYYLEGDVIGNCIATANIELHGTSTPDVTGYTVTGNFVATSSSGGFNITLKNISITGIITTSGGNGESTGYNGGYVTIATSTTGAITSNGGNGSIQGGNGGVITITNSLEIASSTPISATGGNATICGHGGSGGSVTLTNSTYGNINIGAGSDQTIIGNGLCQAPPTGSSGSTGSQSVFGLYTSPPTNNPPPVANQPTTPSKGDTAPSAGSSVGTFNDTKPSTTTNVVVLNSDTYDNSPSLPIIGSIKEIVKGTTEVVNSPASKAVQTVGFFAGLVGAISLYTNALFATPLLASEILLVPIRLWGLFLMAFGLKKRTPPWGTVYDSVTKQPIDPAFVTARDESGKVVAESITDIDGRYGFLLPDGKYHISVARTNYSFPSKKMVGQTTDEMYRDLYFGEEVTVTGGQVIDKNIPLDRRNFDWNEEAKNTQDVMVFHKKNEKIFRKIGNYVFRIGSVISVASVILNPSTYNIIIVMAYVLIGVLSYFGVKGKKLGFIRDRITGKPFPYAIFRVITLDHQTILRSGVCDKEGRYYCIVPKGEYYLEVEKKNPNGSYLKVFQSDLISSTNGIINKNFSI